MEGTHLVLVTHHFTVALVLARYLARTCELCGNACKSTYSAYDNELCTCKLGVSSVVHVVPLSRTTCIYSRTSLSRTYLCMDAYIITESVDSVCRDGTDMPYVAIQTEA